MGMEKIPDSSIDMILADLPYGITDCRWDNLIDLKKYFLQANRIIKKNGAIVLTAQQPFATDLINANRDNFRYEIIWEKTQKMGFVNAKKMPLRGHENVLVFYKKLPTYNPQKVQIETNQKGRRRKQREGRYEGYSHMRTGVYVEDGTRFPHSVLKISNWNGALFGNTENATIHPTQKPLELFQWLIRTYTNEGDLVVDTCMGSGTTAISCMIENRRYIGFEKDTSIYNDCMKRISDFTCPPKKQTHNFDLFSSCE